jgi:hypothetical protein
MIVLRIEHPVPSFEGWKQAFESDPANRARAGVRRYQVMRATDDPNYVLIDLEFDTQAQAEGLLAAMREVWRGVEGTIMSSPRARIVEVVETKEL